MNRLAFLGALVLLGIALLALPAVFARNKLDLFEARGLTLLDGELRKLRSSHLASLKVVDYILHNLPAEARTLVFRQAEIGYYGNGRFVGDIDPRLVDLYGMRDVDSTHRELERLGVSHIVTPNYPTPTLYNSHIDTLVGDPRRVQLVYEYDGTRLLQLLPAARPDDADSEADSDAAGPVFASSAQTEGWSAWSSTDEYRAASRARLDDGVLRLATVERDGVMAARSWIATGRGPLDLSPLRTFSADPLTLECRARYRVTARIGGHGMQQLQVVTYPDNRDPVIHTVWEGLLAGTERAASGLFEAVWLPPSNGQPCADAPARILVRLLGRGELAVRDIAVTRVGDAVASNVMQRRLAVREAGWRVDNGTSPDEILDWDHIDTRGGDAGLRVVQINRRATTLRSPSAPVPATAGGLTVVATIAGVGTLEIRPVADAPCASPTAGGERLFLDRQPRKVRLHFELQTASAECAAGARMIALEFRLLFDPRFPERDGAYATLDLHGPAVQVIADGPAPATIDFPIATRQPADPSPP